jgi:uncharacterized RDD family membrane protein YckC
MERIVERIVASREFEEVLERALASPAVRSALAQQSTSVGAALAAELRRQAVKLDDAAERRPRRLLRPTPRSPRVRPEKPAVPYAGIASRGLALAVDALILTLVFLIGAAVTAVVASLVGGKLRPEWLAGALAGSGWLILQAVYFVTGWSVSGQTPGMRLMGLRVLDAAGAPPGRARSLLRLVGLGLAIVPLFAGFLPVLVDDRRRALQDFLARTVVVHDDPPRRAVESSRSRS